MYVELGLCKLFWQVSKEFMKELKGLIIEIQMLQLISNIWSLAIGYTSRKSRLQGQEGEWPCGRVRYSYDKGTITPCLVFPAPPKQTSQ